MSCPSGVEVFNLNSISLPAKVNFACMAIVKLHFFIINVQREPFKSLLNRKRTTTRTRTLNIRVNQLKP